MYGDQHGKRARKLIEDYELSEEEIRQIVAAARITLATSAARRAIR